MGDCLYIIIPAYNEEANIEQVIADWYPIVERHDGGGSSRLLVVDDGSTDRTGEILFSLRRQYPLLSVLARSNGGHGSAVLAGYHCAVNEGADYIFQTDSDGQTDPSEFEAFWERREHYDMIIGNRKGREDGRERAAVAKVERAMLMYLFHVNLADANTPFRLMSRGFLADALPLIPEDYFLSNMLLSVIAAKMKRRILYRQIRFRPRAGGVNSINRKKILKVGMDAMREFPKLNRQIDRAIREMQEDR